MCPRYPRDNVSDVPTFQTALTKIFIQSPRKTQKLPSEAMLVQCHQTGINTLVIQVSLQTDSSENSDLLSKTTRNSMPHTTLEWCPMPQLPRLGSPSKMGPRTETVRPQTYSHWYPMPQLIQIVLQTGSITD